MSIRKILTEKDPFDLERLKIPSQPVTQNDDYVTVAQELVASLKASVHGGIGLAAPQIGISLRMFVMNRGDIVNRIFINPEIVSGVGRMKFDEGCLSFPGKTKRTVRKQFIKVKYLDLHWNEKVEQFSGVDAICIQHEVEHLNGKLLF